MTAAAGSSRLATASQWALVKEVQALLPEATVTLRVHKLTWKQDPKAPALAVLGVLLTHTFGPFTLRREYAQAHVD